MGLIALATVTGIGGAFALNHPKKVSGTTYYGYKSGTDAKWSLTPPARTSCQADASAIACTITSTASQSVVLGTVNALPPNSNIQNGSAGEFYK